MNKYQNRENKKAIISLLGSSLSDPKAVAIVVGVAIFFSWLPNGISVLLDKILKGDFSFGGSEVAALTQVAIALTILFFIKRAIPKNLDDVDISINPTPQLARALVLFLSKNPKAEESTLFYNLFGFEGNYKMPLEAINYHKEKLDSIIVVCSDESIKQKDYFIRCVINIFGEDMAKKIDTRLVPDLEQAKEVYDFLEKIYEELKTKGISEGDIVFDVTGGQKAVSIAGAMFAIPNNRHLQYVSTTDYKVKHYDLIYAKNDE
ncbi:hypothetical protein CCAL13119_07100 [Campylobacter sp. RM13119]|uniref:TM1812 family CRISPR-associated protein n=1 Tax=Campylobacter californiensis TaxID=1032243 RepID=UPI0014761C67|nr:TM1812 family CRISPR-associated protein [Campylobacter sp. RM13119]MBE3606709.1 hypothetical protein [Campylobacter sp. RM13119]